MTHHRDDLEQRLWSEIDKVRTVMLGLTNSSEGMQPMTGFVDEAQGGTVWIYTRNDTDFFRRVGAGHQGILTLMTKDHDFIASVIGDLREYHDPARIKQFWNPVVSAWYPDGQDDPALTLLRFDAAEAQVWVSHGNPIRFGWEIAKANATKTLPDVGESRHLDL